MISFVEVIIMVTYGTIDVSNKTIENLFFLQIKNQTFENKKTRWYE
mgnify:CR=1 FL=1|jgi:hypothetical protein